MGLLLDTCALIWIVKGDPIRDEAREAVEQAENEDSLFASNVSAWEIGLLAKAGRQAARSLAPDPRTFALNALSSRTLRLAPLTAAILFDASALPGTFHNDPADRLLVQTARVLNVPIMTRDQMILDYAALGHVKAMAC